ncbi:MAG TPA: hypothetical protein VM529_11985 [Gemmata sp.]|nr:hypothetical protein [Gemmata sp.]
MSVSMTCRGCRTRLKTPPGCTKPKIRCPRCGTRTELAAVLSARAYQPAPAEREEDPLPYPDLDPAAARSVPAELPPAGPPLSLDDEPPAAAPPAPATLVFRAAARVTADSAGLLAGPCEVILVPHGMFLETVPFRPSFYAPVGSAVSGAAPSAVVVSLPDGRAVAVEFLGRAADRIAEDAIGLLAGERGVPDAREYRVAPPWLAALALLLAAATAGGAAALARAAELGARAELACAAGVGVAVLAVNAAVLFFTRLSRGGKAGVVAAVAAGAAGVCVLTTAAYLAGLRQRRPLPPEPPPPPPAPAPPVGSPEPPPRPDIPTAVDLAYRDGVYRFEDGPADVTAVATSAGGTVLIAGYRDGSTRVWRLDQPAIDPFSVGPRSDGPPAQIRFDAAGAVVYLSSPGGTVAAVWNDPPAAPVKIPGEHFAAFASPGGERFAARRGTSVVLRHLPADLVRKPPGKGPGFTHVLARDEELPADVKAPLSSPSRLTFLAWHPTGQLLGGLPNGAILNWGATGPAAALVSNDHKAAVRAWAASPATWDFATGDDRGVVGLWEDRAMRPQTFAAATGAVTELAFSPSGSHLAVGDSSGAVRVWDLAAGRATVRVTRVGAHVAFGPNDDTLVLSDGKRLELWATSELAKQP